MALILTLKEGEKFYVDDDPIRIKKVYSGDHAVVETSDGRLVDVMDDRMVEVLDDVLVSLGLSYQSGWARVVIEAPKEKLILREKNYGRRE